MREEGEREKKPERQGLVEEEIINSFLSLKVFSALANEVLKFPFFLLRFCF